MTSEAMPSARNPMPPHTVPTRPTSRRAFVKDITAAVCSVFAEAAFENATAQNTHPLRYKLGCYTRPWDQFDYRVALDGIAEAGFKYAGIMTAKSKSWLVITVDSTSEEVQTVASEAKQRGLKILSIYAGEFPLEKSFDLGVQALKKLVDYCAICECPDLMLAGTPKEALVSDYCRVVLECCDYAAVKGVRLSIKPHGGQNATGPQCKKIIQRVGHPNFGLWYDPGNIFYYSDGQLDPVTDSQSVDGLVVGVSVKDFRRPKDVMVTPGDGEVDFSRVFMNLRKGGFVAGPVLIECLARKETPSGITAEAKRARKFIEAILSAT